MTSGVCMSSTSCVVGGGDSITGTPPAPFVYTTSNGGTSWVSSTLPSGFLGVVYGLNCPSATECFMLAQGSTTTYAPLPTILESTDAGASWNIIYQATFDTIFPTPTTNISCISTTQCTAVVTELGGGGTTSPSITPEALVTTDGGTSWSVNPMGPTELASVAPLPEMAISVTCPSVSLCIGSGEQFPFSFTSSGNKSGSGVIWISTDGGVSWTSQLIGPAPTTSNGYITTAINCVTSTSCVVDEDSYVIDLVGTEQYLVPTGGLFQVSSNAGSTWTSQAAPAPPLSTEGTLVAGVSCISATNCLASGGVGNATPGTPSIAGEIFQGSTSTAAPTITSISPTSGPTAGGTTVTITGSGFTGATSVDFGSVGATSFNVVSDTQVSAISPPGTSTVDVTVTTPNGISATSTADKFTYQAAPTITSISPTSGPTAGGTTVTITGSGFTGATSVDFGSVGATSFSVVSDTQVSAISPPGTGSVDVTVTTPNGISATSTADKFTYTVGPTITSISPTLGPTTGGTTVTITGTGFTGATAVAFGTTMAAYSVISSTRIQVISPQNAFGIVDITVTTPNGTSATSTADKFTYQAAPTITSISPTSGPTTGGTTVTITGTGFTGATAVAFGSIGATSFSVVSDTQVSAISPPGTATVDVTVTTPNGTSSTGSADQFSYLSPVPNWQPITAAPSPSGRVFAVSTYDPNTHAVLLFGGAAVQPDGTYKVLGDTWSWSGSSWSQLNPLASPPARAGASMAYDPSSGTVILFGGLTTSNGNFQTLNDLWSWNGRTWSQLFTNIGPSARTEASMAYDVASRCFILFGGMALNQGIPALLNDTWELCGRKWTQLESTVSPTPRSAAASTYDPQVRGIVLFGGLGSQALGDTWQWVGGKWVKQDPSVSPPARAGASAAFDAQTNEVILFGGAPTLLSTQLDSDTWSYDATTDSWKQQSLVPQVQHSRLAGRSDQSTVQYEFSTSEAVWMPNLVSHSSATSGTPGARLGASMAFDPSTNQVVLNGGFTGSPIQLLDGVTYSKVRYAPPTQIPPPGGTIVTPKDVNVALDQIQLLDDTWTFQNGKWTQQAISPGPRRAAVFATFQTNVDPSYQQDQLQQGNDTFSSGHNDVLLFGGQAADGTPLGDTWIWNGSTWNPTEGPSPSPRYGSAAVSLRGGGVLVFGGVSTNGAALSDTWVWSGSAWVKKTPPGLIPAARSFATLIDISTHPNGRSSLETCGIPQGKSGIALLFGGRDNSGNILDDTWEWDGNQWYQCHPLNSPSPRYLAVGISAVADWGNGQPRDPQSSDNGEKFDSIIFGGTLEEGYVSSETWAWDGNTWLRIHTSVTPPARTGGESSSSRMADWSSLNTSFMTGGLSQSGGLLSDLWLWNGTSWLQQTTGAPGTYQGGMAVGPNDTIMLFGGSLTSDPPTDQNSAWEFDVDARNIG